MPRRKWSGSRPLTICQRTARPRLTNRPKLPERRVRGTAPFRTSSGNGRTNTCVAEFDNYRKRTDKEKKGLIALGGEDVIKSLLGVMDDIDRALVAMSQTDDIESVRKGIELIHQKLLDTLHGKGVQEIEAVGNEFDTDLHEAVAKLPVEDDKKGKIIDVVQKGYKLKDKVVRYAKVVVGE